MSRIDEIRARAEAAKPRLVDCQDTSALNRGITLLTKYCLKNEKPMLDHAHQDIPYLLEEVERLQKRVAELESNHDQAKPHLAYYHAHEMGGPWQSETIMNDAIKRMRNDMNAALKSVQMQLQTFNKNLIGCVIHAKNKRNDAFLDRSVFAVEEICLETGLTVITEYWGWWFDNDDSNGFKIRFGMQKLSQVDVELNELKKPATLRIHEKYAEQFGKTEQIKSQPLL